MREPAAFEEFKPSKYPMQSRFAANFDGDHTAFYERTIFPSDSHRNQQLNLMTAS